MAADLPLEELARLPEFYHPVASPDGDRVAFYWDRSGRNELYVRDLDTGTTTQVSDGEVPRTARWPIMWRGDGESVYYHRDDAGDEQNDLHELTPDGQDELVVDMGGQCILADSTTDGRWLLFEGIASGQLNLYRLDTQTGEQDQLTDYELPVFGGAFSPDGDRIAYVTNESADLKNRDVYVANADGTEPRNLRIGEDGAEASLGAWHPDGERLLVGDNTEDLNRCGVYDIQTDEVEWFGPHEAEESPVAFTPDGERFLAHRTRRGAVVPVVYDVETGEGREFDLPEGVAGVAGGGPGGAGSLRQSFTADGDVLVSHSTGAKRSELLTYDLETDTHEVLIEAEYGSIDPDAFVEAEYVTYDSEDGLDIGALLYDSGERPSPGVVHVHGGPHAQSLRAFSPYVQFLLSRGYSVLQPNYRGSTGRGRAFKNEIRHDWGGMEQADVAAGGRWLKDRDWIDDERVAVYGGSYGGYSAYMQLVTYPDLWTAGVAWVGITDLHELFEEDMPHFKAALREDMGDPEENYELWRDRSPVEHVERIEAPILIVHGVNDPRCPIGQARLFKEALETERGWTAGEEFAYEELADEGHGSTDQDQKVRAFEILADFLEERC